MTATTCILAPPLLQHRQAVVAAANFGGGNNGTNMATYNPPFSRAGGGNNNISSKSSASLTTTTSLSIQAKKKSILKKVDVRSTSRDPESEFLLEAEDLLVMSPRILSPTPPPASILLSSTPPTAVHEADAPPHGDLTRDHEAVLVRTRSCSPASDTLALLEGGGASARDAGAKPTNVYRSQVSTPVVSKKLLKIVRTSSQGKYV